METPKPNHKRPHHNPKTETVLCLPPHRAEAIDDDPIPTSLLKEVGEVTNDPDGWMRRPNSQFEDRSPVELLGTPEEPRILRVIKAAQQGFFAGSCPPADGSRPPR